MHLSTADVWLGIVVCIAIFAVYLSERRAVRLPKVGEVYTSFSITGLRLRDVGPRRLFDQPALIVLENGHLTVHYWHFADHSSHPGLEVISCLLEDSKRPLELYFYADTFFDSPSLMNMLTSELTTLDRQHLNEIFSTMRATLLAAKRI